MYGFGEYQESYLETIARTNAELRQREAKKLQEQAELRAAQERRARQAQYNAIQEQYYVNMGMYGVTESTQLTFDDVRKNLTKNLLESVLSSFIKKTAVDDTLADANPEMMDSILHDVIEDIGIDNLESMMETSNTYTADIMQDINMLVESAIREAKDPDKVELTKDKEESLINSIMDDATTEDIMGLIAQKIISANVECISKLQIDSGTIQDIIAASEQKLNSIKTGNAQLDKKYAEMYTEQANEDIKAVRENGVKSVYEQLMFNLSKAVVTSDSLRENYINKKSSHLDMEKIDRKAKAIYTVFECMNSLGLLKIKNPNDVLQLITVG